MRIPDHMDGPDMLAIEADQLPIFARVIVGPENYADGRPIPTISRKQIEITCPTAIARLSIEIAEELRKWLNEKLGGE